jgi:hypothetical protein
LEVRVESELALSFDFFDVDASGALRQTHSVVESSGARVIRAHVAEQNCWCEWSRKGWESGSRIVLASIEVEEHVQFEPRAHQ